jgi:hypothetical protein
MGWGRKQSFGIEYIGVGQVMYHRLKVVGIAAPDIGRNDDPRPLTGQGATLRILRNFGF